MSTQRQDDTGLDRLLRSALVSAQSAGGKDCPDAEQVAAYVDGGLTARERTDLEPHLAACARCQAVLAVLARESAAEQPAAEAKPSAWRAFLALPTLRWLVPASAAALGVILYVAVQQGQDGDINLATPPVTVRARPEALVTAKPTELAARASVDAVAAAPPAARPDAQSAALVSLERPRTEAAPRVEGAPRQTDITPANVAGGTSERKTAQILSREQATSPQAAGTSAQEGQAGGLEGLWKQASFVVHARAIVTRPPVGPLLPTEFEVLEVFKRHAEIKPTDRFVISQIGGDASDERAIYRASNWVRLQVGSEYVLFLERTPGADDPDRLGALGESTGFYRLEGDRVVIGQNPGADPSLSKAALLARLRQFAGTAAR